MSETRNILLCGVGGQGTILASKLLAYSLVQGGFDVKMSEIHGMSQRGGSVVTQVRFGDQVYSPIIGSGSADILVSFEAMEALRYLPVLRPQGTVVVNNYQIPTATTASGSEIYPEGVLEALQAQANTYVLDAAKMAGEMGNKKCMNVVLLGALVKRMGLESLDWESALAACLKPGLVEMNRKALAAGMAAVS